MALLYNKTQRGNPGDRTAPKKWYLILKSLGMMKEKEVAREISEETTLNPKEAEMAIYQYQKVLLKALLMGRTVQLGELGSFNLTISCEGSDTEAEAQPSKVKSVNLRFTPSLAVKQSLGKASFKPATKI